jgi:hypothetical protein
LYDYVAGINGDNPVPNKIGEISAESAYKNAIIENQVIESFDNGFRAIEVLAGDPLAENYFDALHPSFEIIGHECPRKLEVCPTCRKDLLPGLRQRHQGFLRDLCAANQAQLNLTSMSPEASGTSLSNPATVSSSQPGRCGANFRPERADPQLSSAVRAAAVPLSLSQRPARPRLDGVRGAEGAVSHP